MLKAKLRTQDETLWFKLDQSVVEHVCTYICIYVCIYVNT